MPSQPVTPPFTLISDSDILDPASLYAIADMAHSRGDVRFTPGGGVLFDTPISRDERRNLPVPVARNPRFIELPQDRFWATYATHPAFRAFVDGFTIAHVQPGYRLVVIPLSKALTEAQLRKIADAAEAFGHGTIRLTADVSIRLTNVPNALLRPLFVLLGEAGLLVARDQSLAA